MPGFARFALILHLNMDQLALLTNDPRLTLAATCVGGCVIALFGLKVRVFSPRLGRWVVVRRACFSLLHGFPPYAQVIVNFYKYFLRPSKNLKKLGEWAVVTGATDGIGKAYAFKFAKKGLNVVLISRTKSKLDDCAAEIKEKYGVEVKVIACDYSNFDDKARAGVAKVCGKLDVGILVNNVGVSYVYPKYFSELKEEEVDGLMEMNVNSTTWMTHMILPGMMERKRGSIVNVASAAGVNTMPLLAQYSAAKGYITMFTRGLSVECAKKNVTVSVVTPFYVATKLAKMRKALTVPTPPAFVDMAVRWIGHGDVVVQPFWIHGVMGWVVNSLPTFLSDSVIMGMHAGIRARGIKKDARKAAEGKGN